MYHGLGVSGVMLPCARSVSRQVRNWPVSWGHGIGNVKVQEVTSLKEHKNDNFFVSDFEFCTISLLVMFNY